MQIRMLALLLTAVISISAVAATDVEPEKSPANEVESEDPMNVTAQLFGQIFEASGETLFCGCSYNDWELANDEIAPCYYYLPDKRDTKISWHRVVEVNQFAKTRQCWGQGGIKNCIRNDKAVRYYMSDPLTYLPAEPQIARLTERFRGYKSGFPGSDDFGVYCNSKTDGTTRRIIPRIKARGDLARVILYIAERYKLETDIPRQELLEWNNIDPVSAAECARSEKSRQIIGYGNPFIDSGCHKYR